MRVFWVSGHLLIQFENGVPQILLLCSVVFKQHAVIPVEGSLPPSLRMVRKGPSCIVGLLLPWSQKPYK